MRLSAGADIALGWRDASMDASLELSTKVLEYGVLGLPVVLDRTPMHERLLGRDYPLFVSSEDDVVAAIAAWSWRTRPSPPWRRSACGSASAEHTFERGTERLQAILAQGLSGTLRPAAARPLRDRRRGPRPQVLRGDPGPARGPPRRRDPHGPVVPDQRHDPIRSEALLEWADLIVCEWFGQNAVWYSRHKRPDQRLVVRLHRFEL